MGALSFTSRTGRAAAAATLLVAATIAFASPAEAQELPVTTAADGGAGSLRTRIDQANTSDAADVIVLQAGVEYVLSSCSPGELTSSGGPLTIVGNGATIRQTCAGERVLRNTGSGLLSIQNVTLTGGDASTDGGAVLSTAGPVAIIGSTITANQAEGDGGGVFVDGTALTIDESVISNNQAFDYGGGVGVDGELRMSDTVVTGNTVLATDAYGGGVYVLPGDGTPALVSGSKFSGNHADGAAALGGGIYVAGDSLLLDSSTIADNTAGVDGGGIYAYYDTAISRSTVSGNSAGGRGGGIFSYDPELAVYSSTIAANTAAVSGGGVFAEGFGLALDFVTFNGNSSPGGAQIDLGGGTLATFGSVLADPIGGSSCNAVATVSAGYNFEQAANTCGLRAVTDVVAGGSAGLGTLGDNGGPTQTELPALTSPLADAISAEVPECTGVDQRGEPRPQGGACDIGAVELAARATPLTGAPLAFAG